MAGPTTEGGWRSRAGTRVGQLGLAAIVLGVGAVVLSAGVSGGAMRPHWQTGVTTILKNAADDSTIADGEMIPAGTRVYDTAQLSHSQPQVPTGTVTYNFFTNSSCAGPTSSSQSVDVANDGTVPNADATDALSLGNYAFDAVYSGDFQYPGSSSSCEPFKVCHTFGTTTTTSPPPTTTTPPSTTTSVTTITTTTTTELSTTTVPSTSVPSTSVPETSVPATSTTLVPTTSTSTPTNETSSTTTTPASASSTTTTASGGGSTTSTSAPSTRSGGGTSSTTVGSQASGGRTPGPVTAPASALAFTGSGILMRVVAGMGGLLILAGAWLLAFVEQPRRLLLRLLHDRGHHRH